MTFAYVPSHSVASSVYTMESCSLMYTLYPVIGDPLSIGVDQVITATLDETDVVGADGALGSLAHRTTNSSEKSLYPYEFLD